MSTSVSLELLKQLKDLGIWRFKGVDFEVEFFAVKLYPGAEASPAPNAAPVAREMPAWPQLTEDIATVDNGSDYRNLLEWST